MLNPEPNRVCNFKDFANHVKEAFSLTPYSDVTMTLLNLPLVGSVRLQTEVNTSPELRKIERAIQNCWTTQTQEHAGTKFISFGLSHTVHMDSGHVALEGRIFWEGGLIEQVSFSSIIETVSYRFMPLSEGANSGAFVALCQARPWGFTTKPLSRGF